jgi:predicted AAA+ superfamily ATPase
MKFNRLLDPPEQNFFLFGPRGTGKSTWLQEQIKPQLTIDLLRSDEYLRLSADPSLLRARVEALPPDSKIVIDEIQKLPVLLDEVHSLIFKHGNRLKFALTGSSARKLKQSNANMLAGRAIKREMFPLCSQELGESFHLEDALKFGTLPGLFGLSNTREREDFLYSYVETYLREEIVREAVVRQLQNYHRFLRHAAIMNAQVVNMSNISREAGVARSTVDGYFEILVDTLLGTFVEPIHLKAKVKEVVNPKFYFFDCGVVRALRGELDAPLNDGIGAQLETFVLNELRAYSSYLGKNLEFYYWGTPSGAEVDFIVSKGKSKWAIEVKSARRWDTKFNKGLHSAADSRQLDRLIGIYLGDHRITIDDVDVYPVRDFCKELFAGRILT